MFKTLHKQQKGFTLIEVLVVVGILAILLAITLIALNPASHFQATRNTQRSSDVTAVLDAIYQYQAANKGNLPSAVSSLTAGTPYDLSNDPGVATKVDLCSALAPAYIADLPRDPDTSVSYTHDASDAPITSSTCAAPRYKTGYTLTASASSRFTVSAPAAEGGATISVTR